LAYAVQRRTREIGVRVALGASPGLVMKSVLSRALALVACGLALGLVGALAGETMLRSLLSEEGPGTAPVLVLACAVVATTAVVAAYWPARWAASIDPTRALHVE
jgi:ABC-type antimicrobial peptide transport system permease subunit